ncbi:pirin-like protein [Leptospira ryugenii]|uniref:Pirin-like protein n=1 Tax=Leptospira ryugenii TaxID=1917863 RepID=A0A2P2DVK8_9LEPT|nr:pirin family protein [Leptospira ryugenii]GBF48663.1 pirin-like protein [Leptospira ryugenii]
MATSSNTILGMAKMGFQWQTVDPFLFCVHHEDFYPKSNGNFGPDASLVGREIGQDFAGKDGWRMYHGESIPGFPSHPHRGFETITVVRSGFVDHSDSMGAVGRYSAGDVQWMTAGAGIQHSEMFPLLDQHKDNRLELFQIWLNLPKKSKFVRPHFTMLWAESIPKLSFLDENGRKTHVELIAGQLGGEKAQNPPPDSWASNPEHSVQVWIIQLEAKAKWQIPAHNKNLGRMLYFYRGTQLTLDGQTIPDYHQVQLISDENIELENLSDNRIEILLLESKPIQEPVVQYGPFVMNTREEIQDAFQDFQKTGFGGWPWKSHEPVHGTNAGRFARHADGREEFPSV